MLFLVIAEQHIFGTNNLLALFGLYQTKHLSIPNQHC